MTARPHPSRSQRHTSPSTPPSGSATVVTWVNPQRASTELEDEVSAPGIGFVVGLPLAGGLERGRQCLGEPGPACDDGDAEALGEGGVALDEGFDPIEPNRLDPNGRSVIVHQHRFALFPRAFWRCSELSRSLGGNPEAESEVRRAVEHHVLALGVQQLQR